MADEREKILKILMEYITDKESVGQAKAALKDIEKSVDSTKGRLKDLTKMLDDDLAKGTSKWADKMNEVDLVGRKLEALGRSIGGTWGEALASIGGGLGSIADSAELLQGLKGLGGLGGGGGGAAAGIGGLGALGLGLAGVAGAGVGALGYEGLRSAGIAKGASLGQFATVGAYGAGSLFGQDTAEAWGKAIGELTGTIPTATTETKKLTESIKSVGQASKAAAFDPNSVRYAIGQNPGGVSLPGEGTISLQTASFGRKKSLEEIEKAERDITQQRSKVIRDSKDELAQAERDYQREQRQSIARYNMETKQQEREHQLQMQRLREDTNRRLSGLAIERDAVSYLQEWQAGQSNLKRAEEDFQMGQQQRKDQLNLQLSQEKQDFEAMQAERKRAASRQLDDLKTSLSQESEIRKSGYEKALSHTRDFVGAMQNLYSSLSFGPGAGNSVDRRISQTLGGY